MKKGNLFFTVLIIACIAFAVKNFSSDDGGSASGDYGYSINIDDTADIGYSMPEHRNMYNQLDSTEKSLYSELRKGIAAGNTTITVYTDDYDRSVEALYQAYDALYYDFPEFFWLNGGWRCSGEYAGIGYNMIIETGCYDYWQYTNDKDGYIEAALSEAKRIAAMADTLENDYEKAKFVHDYLVVNAEYDYVCLEEINQTVQRASSQQSHTIYGCLVNKVCVCDGYAKSFQLIMSMLGIDAEYVEGDAGGGHAWNYILLGGDEYWLDVTWDENELEDDNGNLLAPNGANYGYFCVTDNKLYETHTPDPTFKIPVCDSDEYNFFVYENSHLQSYDFEAFCNAVAEQKGAQIIHIRFASESALETAVDQIVHNGKYKQVPGLSDKNPQFYSNKNENIMHIYLS